MKSVFVVLALSAIVVGSVEAQIPPVETLRPAPVQAPAEPQPPVVTAPTPAPLPGPPPVPAGPVSAPAALAAAPAPLSQAAIESRSAAIRAMEGVLAQKVKDGAALIARQMQALDPGIMLLTGPLRARGFILEGYGVFFDVEIPMVLPSVAWYARNLQRDRMAGQVSEPPAGAQRTSDTVITTEAFLDNPDRHYVESIKSALINAMLEYSKPLGLQAHEWFTVAARDSGGPMLPNEIYDPPTMMIRVKGADLAEYLAGRLTQEEARKKVEVRKF